MKKVKGQPITGARPQYSKKAPLVPDAKETSANAQTMIAEAPTPFKNKMEPNNMPSGTGPRGAVPGSVQKPYAGKSGSTVGVRALPSGGPVGQRKAINQGGQIGGRMGFPPPARKAGSVSGFKAKKGAAFYGE